jgi:hypothetical protein
MTGQPGGMPVPEPANRAAQVSWVLCSLSVQFWAVNVAFDDFPGATAGGLNAKCVISITAETAHAEDDATAVPLAAATVNPPPVMTISPASSALRIMTFPFHTEAKA